MVFLWCEAFVLSGERERELRVCRQAEVLEKEGRGVTAKKKIN